MFDFHFFLDIEKWKKKICGQFSFLSELKTEMKRN